MRLIDPGAGELSDRLTILSLKQLYGGLRGMETKHWRDEQTKLLSQIRSRTLNGTWFDAVLGLGAVNAAIWHAEDTLREARATYGRVAKIAIGDAEEVALLAFRIQELNDQRAALIDRINKDAGEHVGGEKLLAHIGEGER